MVIKGRAQLLKALLAESQGIIVVNLMERPTAKFRELLWLLKSSSQSQQAAQEREQTDGN